MSSECQMYGNRQPGMNVLSLPQLSPLGCAPILADFSGIFVAHLGQKQTRDLLKARWFDAHKGCFKSPDRGIPY